MHAERDVFYCDSLPTGVVLPLLVNERELPIRIHHIDDLGHGIGQAPKPLLILAQGEVGRRQRALMFRHGGNAYHNPALIMMMSPSTRRAVPMPVSYSPASWPHSLSRPSTTGTAMRNGRARRASRPARLGSSRMRIG